jgi:hypothetical protein
MPWTAPSAWIGLSGTFLLAACGSGSLPGERDAGPTEAIVIRIPDARAGAGGTTGIGTGGVVTGGGSGGTLGGDAGQVAAACHSEDGLCNTATDYCCAGFTCGSTSLEPSYHCMKNCAAHAECATGCCAPLGDSAITVCLDQAFCPSIFCQKEEEACLDGLPCCEGMACAVFGTTTQTSACKPLCTEHEECATGCCAPLGNTGTKVCLGQSYCPSIFCLAEEAACQGGLPCCEGMVCAVFQTTPTTSACKPICKENRDCETKCCVSLGTDYPSACLDESYCGTPS